MANRRNAVLALMLLVALIVSACNLSGAPSEEQIAQTASAVVTGTGQPTRTPLTTSGVPTTFPLTRPTNLPTFAFPTAIVSVPTRISTSAPPPVFIPTFPPQQNQPVSIVILSPVSGNVVAGNVSIIGSATHPQFLQYQVEFGPDPNPGNLWFPATNAVTSPVLNGLLGVWNTNSVQDSRYQLRLRVYLRDGTLLTTVINNITVQNRISTPVPSPTPNIPRPIAAFTQDRSSGDVPLTVQFSNQSTGAINSLSWNFGDGNTSSEIHPRHTFGAPGLYTVTLTVNGPGGSSNVASQINVTSPTAPVAGFIMDRNTGLAPLTVQFTDQSVGNITSYQWFFSDGSTSALRNPSHTFTTPGTYNIFLTVSGPGGASSATRQLTVTVLVSPTFTPSLTFTPTFTPSFTPTTTETPTNTTTVVPPTFTPTATNTEFPAPVAFFTVSSVPNNTLSVQFINASTGLIARYDWDFGDGTTSNEPNPLHTYATSGTFTAKLTVTDTLGRSSTYSITGTLVSPTDTSLPPSSTLPPTATETPTNTTTVVPPTSTFTATSTATNTEFPAPEAFFTLNGVPNDPLTVQFTNGSTGQIAQYGWAFGDGTFSDQQNPTHTYATGGTYTVTLNVRDTLNRTSSYSVTGTLTEPTATSLPPTATFTETPTETPIPPTETFTPTATNTEFPAPEAFFSLNGVPNDPLSVQFTNGSTGQIAQYGWAFGDGTFSDQQNPT
ncbi:MAG: PKD domain-containing protein, partial [Chloroflexota bacterium]